MSGGLLLGFLKLMTLCTEPLPNTVVDILNTFKANYPWYCVVTTGVNEGGSLRLPAHLGLRGGRGGFPVISCQTTREDTWLIKMRVKRAMSQISKLVPTALARPRKSSLVQSPPLFYILVKYSMNLRAFGWGN